MRSDASNGDFVTICFLGMFHQGVKQRNSVFLSKLQMLTLMAYVKSRFQI